MAGTIIGQQVNVTFAYTLKNRLIEQYGDSRSWQDHTFWRFPKAEILASLQPEVLRPLSISQRKAEYVIGFARLIAEAHSNGDNRGSISLSNGGILGGSVFTLKLP